MTILKFIQTAEVSLFPGLTCGNSTTPNGWSSAPNNALELVALSDDADFAQDTSNLSGTSTVDQGYILENIWDTVDFVGVDSLDIELRYGWASAFTNRTWGSLSARIMNGTQVLAAATSGGDFQTVASSITNTTPQNSGAVSFSYVNKYNFISKTGPTITDWNNAILELRIVSTRSGGGSSVARRVYAASVKGQYDAYLPRLKYYNGSIWVSKPLSVNISGNWVYKPLKRWDGSQWVRDILDK